MTTIAVGLRLFLPLAYGGDRGRIESPLASGLLHDELTRFR